VPAKSRPSSSGDSSIETTLLSGVVDVLSAT
jgi:hypothetical protein